MQGRPVKIPTTPLSAILVLLLIGTSLLSTVHASSFRVTPLRVDFSEQHRTTQLSIENLSMQMVTLQASVMKWEQQGDQETLVPSRDIFVSPPVLTLAPRGKQVLRLRHLADMPSDTEQAYRLYLQDTAARAQQGGGATLAIRMGLPVFVTPRGARPEPQISTRYDNSSNTWQVRVSNPGNAHLRVFGLDAFRADSERRSLTMDDFLGQVTQATDGFPYVLPGQTKEWHLSAPANAQLRLRTNVYGHRQHGFDRRGTAWLTEPDSPTAR